ncbi:MAG: cytochrome c biogenesis protein CcsA [Bacteroidaceae bacterium]|nr:cytochrome c biogenesis protein CcsA [Bacteroidaceae bacterium]
MVTIFKRIILVVFSLLLIAMAFGTFIEKTTEHGIALDRVYHSWWFISLWIVFALLGLWQFLRVQLWHRPNILALHISFVVILMGAFISFLTGKDGTLHLREGAQADYFYLEDNSEPSSLPITLRLDSFRIRYYAGATMPADFISYVQYHDKINGQTTQGAISMNHILKAKGYRFYQSSYDSDGRGTILTVKHDPWGIAITYAGYILLAISLLWQLFSPGGHFRQLLRHPLLKRGSLFLFLSFASLPMWSRQAIPTINRAKADSMASMQVIYNDRIVPLNTVARDFLQKIYGRPSYKSLSAEQVLIGWSLRPDVWKDQPMLKIKNEKLRHRLGINSPYATTAQLFGPNQQYKVNKLSGEQGLDGPLSKSIRELDEKMGLILMATEGKLIQPVPQGTTPLSPQRVKAELLYNQLPIVKILFMLNLTLGFLSFFLLIGGFIRRRRWIQPTLNILLFCSLLALAFHYSLRWYISGRIPLGNGYETMLFMSLALLIFTAILQRKFRFILPFGFLLSGFTLLVAHLGQMNPQITPLMPVLNSPLLSAHVSIIMISYALLAILMFNGILALILRRKESYSQHMDQLTLLSHLLLYPAVALLAIGIFLGAVWANISWGTYWSWDPKEVWALITLMIYSVPLHRKSLPQMTRPLWFHIYLVLSFLAVLMTYFGVNYFLGGMHSYA